MSATEPVDFFISYNIDDVDWATWIASQLEAAGYRTIVDAWDFRPGGNWVLLMDDACRRASRILVVLSPSYLTKSVFTRAEYAPFFAADPHGFQRRLVPVIVERCEPSGLLGSLIAIRLAGKMEDQARAELLAGVGDQRPPTAPPPFPGGRDGPPFPPAVAVATQAGPQGAATRVRSGAPEHKPALDWIPVQSWSEPTWLGELIDLPSSARILEVHLVPSPGWHDPAASELACADGWLVAVGRSCGVFSPEESVELRHGPRFVAAVGSASPASGVAMLSSGQRTVWCEAPDHEAVVDQLSVLLQLIAQIGATDPAARVGLAACLSPPGFKVFPDRHLKAVLLSLAHQEIAAELAAGLRRP